jgi:hypothetical protein
MQEFIREENLKLYRTALAGTDDAEQRRVLFLLIACVLEQQRNPDPDPE